MTVFRLGSFVGISCRHIAHDGQYSNSFSSILSKLNLDCRATSNTSPSSTYFPLAKLPREVRDKIFVDVLALDPLKQVPPLLIVLGCSKEWIEDYQEAQRMYVQQNYVVSVRNQEKFKYMDRKRRMAIRYLRFEVLQR